MLRFDELSSERLRQWLLLLNLNLCPISSFYKYEGGLACIGFFI